DVHGAVAPGVDLAAIRVLDGDGRIVEHRHRGRLEELLGGDPFPLLAAVGEVVLKHPRAREPRRGPDPALRRGLVLRRSEGDGVPPLDKMGGDRVAAEDWVHDSLFGTFTGPSK